MTGESRATSRPRPHATSIWPIRRFPGSSWVQLNGFRDDMVDVCLPATDRSGEFRCTSLTRADARLLAKRINECLDATVLR